MEDLYLNNDELQESSHMELSRLKAIKIDVENLHAQYLSISENVTFDDDSFLKEINDYLNNVTDTIIEISSDIFSLDNDQALLPVGTILHFAGKIIPFGWILCNGQTIDSAKFPQLVALVGRNTPNLIDHYLMGDMQDYYGVSLGSESYLFDWSILPKQQIYTDVKYNYYTSAIINTNNNGNGYNYLVKNGDQRVEVSADFTIGGDQSISLNPEHINLSYIIKAL